MEALSPWHLLIIAACFIMFFGAKRLPDAARSLGRSARIMKSELKGMHEDPKPAEPEAAVVVDDAAAPVVVQDVPRTVVVEEIPQPVVVAAQHNGRR